MHKNPEQLDGIMTDPQSRVGSFVFVESQWAATHIAGSNWKPTGHRSASKIVELWIPLF